MLGSIGHVRGDMMFVRIGPFVSLDEAEAPCPTIYLGTLTPTSIMFALSLTGRTVILRLHRREALVSSSMSMP
jgi:hypothetical protein